MELIPDLGYWKNSLACLGLFYAGKTAAGWLGDMYADMYAYKTLLMLLMGEREDPSSILRCGAMTQISAIKLNKIK